MAVQIAGILLVAPTATVGSWFAVNADLVSLAFFAWSVLTLAFAAAERLLTRSDLLTRWEPRKLPPLREQSAISRTASAFELVFQLGVGALVPVWTLRAALPSGVFHVGDLEIGLSTAWTTFLWSVALLALANAALAAASLAWPWWTVRRALARAACNCGIGILSWWGMQSHLLAHIASPEIALERARDITAAINHGLEQVAPLALVVWGIVLAVDIYRVWRVSTSGTGGRETGWPASPALNSPSATRGPRA